MPKRRPPPPPPPLQVYVPDHEGTAQIEHDTQRDLHSMPSGNISHNTSMDNTDKGMIQYLLQPGTKVQTIPAISELCKWVHACCSQAIFCRGVGKPVYVHAKDILVKYPHSLTI